MEENPSVDEAAPDSGEPAGERSEGLATAEQAAGPSEHAPRGTLAPPSRDAVAGCTGEDCFGAAFTSLLGGEDALAAEILSVAGRERGRGAAARIDCGARRLTLLHVACMRGAADVVEQLLGLGADPRGVDAAGNTPLHLAVEGAAITPPWSTLRMAAALLAAGADAGAKTGEGWPTVLLAVLAGAPAVLLHLLAAHGADPNEAEPEEGLTPLHLAARAGDVATMRALLRAGACCNARDARSRTPLFDALCADDSVCVAVLVNLGADLDVVDARGWSPFAHGLHLVSTRRGCSKRLLLLLADNGAWDARSAATTLIQRLQVTHFMEEAQNRFHEQLASLRSRGLPHETPWAPYVRFAVPPQAQPACPLCSAEFGFFTPRVRHALPPFPRPVTASCFPLRFLLWSPALLLALWALGLRQLLPDARGRAAPFGGRGRGRERGRRVRHPVAGGVPACAPAGPTARSLLSVLHAVLPATSANGALPPRGVAIEGRRRAFLPTSPLPLKPGSAERAQEGESHLSGQRRHSVGAVAV